MSESIIIFDDEENLTEEAYDFFHKMDRFQLTEVLREIFYAGYSTRIRGMVNEAIDKAILEGSLVENEV